MKKQVLCLYGSLLLVSCSLFLVVGCSAVSSPTTTTTGSSTSTTSTTINSQAYYPHAEGDSMRIDMQGQDYYVIATFEGTIDISPTITAQRLLSTAMYHGSPYSSETYAVINDSGVFSYGSSGHTTTEADIILAFPLSVGQTWIRSSSSTMTSEATIVSRESVTVAAGTFDCFKIVYLNHYSYTTETSTDYYWYGFNAGIVKLTTSTSTTELDLTWKNY